MGIREGGFGCSCVPISQSRADGDAGSGDFEYVEFDDVGHAGGGVDYRTRAFELLVDFLDRCL